MTMESNIKPKLYSKIYEMGSFTNILLKDVERALFGRDYELADKILKKGKEINSLEEDIIGHLLKESLSPNDLSRLRLILESVRRTAEYVTDIAEIILNLTVIETVYEVT